MNISIPEHSPIRLKQTILDAATTLGPYVEPWGNPIALLGALAEVESQFGELNVPRPEIQYMYGGKYFDYYQRRRWLKWGGLVGMSYSSFQIMHPTAVELGFSEDRCPLELWDDSIAVIFVLLYIRKRLIDKGCSSVGEFADGYNSGSFKDGNVPEEYMKKFLSAYNSVVKRRELWRE